MKRKPAIRYSPRGDFKSIVKFTEVKLRYTFVDRESRFSMFRYFGYFHTLSLSVFFYKGVFQICTLNLSLHFMLNKIPTSRQFYILIVMAIAKTVKVFSFSIILGFFFLSFCFPI